MKVLLNTSIYNQYSAAQRQKPTFKSDKGEILHELGGVVTGYNRLKELAEVKTEMDGWKVAMKMADYGNPVRHAAWGAGLAKGSAVGAMLGGPVGAIIGAGIGALATNYLCNKVRNKILDKVADWAEGE